MITIRRTKVLSKNVINAFGEHAFKEWKLLGLRQRLFYASMKKLWVVYYDDKPCCVLGFRRTSLLGTGGEVTFMLCRGFSKHSKELLAFIRRILRKVTYFYKTLMVKVDENFWIGDKFVKFFGFQHVNQTTDVSGVNLKLYELRASWQ